MSQETLKITPQSLAHKLIRTGCSLEDLIEELHGTVEEISETLYSDDFRSHHRLRIDLAIAQAQLQAADFLPACTGKLLRLTDSEKPEVARRSIMAVMTIAGIQTKSPDSRAARPSHDEDFEQFQLPKLSTEQQQVVSELAELSHDQREELCTLAKLPIGEREELQHVASANRRLKDDAGINLLELTNHQFHGFESHTRQFFKDLGIRLAGTHDTPIPWRNSLHNPDARAQAHKILAQKSTQTLPNSDPLNINQTPINTAPNAPTTPPFGVPPSGGSDLANSSAPPPPQ